MMNQYGRHLVIGKNDGLQALASLNHMKLVYEKLEFIVSGDLYSTAFHSNSLFHLILGFI